jgi:hypothetical protein
LAPARLRNFSKVQPSSFIGVATARSPAFERRTVENRVARASRQLRNGHAALTYEFEGISLRTSDYAAGSVCENVSGGEEDTENGDAEVSHDGWTDLQIAMSTF